MRIKSALLLLLTGLLVIGGAALPWAVSLGQDRYLENQVETWVFDPVGLRLGDEPAVWPALCLMSGGIDLLSWTGETNLQEKDARAAALEAAAALEEAGLAAAGISGISLEDMWVEPNLIVSTDVRGLSAVVWIFNWDWDGGFCSILIDDSTGKMVQAVVAAGYLEDPEEAYKQMEAWRAFLAGYYGLEEVEYLGDRAFQSDAEPAFPERRFILGFDLGEELGKHKIILDLLGELAAFNI